MEPVAREALESRAALDRLQRQTELQCVALAVAGIVLGVWLNWGFALVGFVCAYALNRTRRPQIDQLLKEHRARMLGRDYR